MKPPTLHIVILGLSITSSWGNGHATTYRGLVKGLVGRGHRVLFLERDLEWYAANRDLPDPPYGQTQLYTSVDELKEKFGAMIREADLVMVGSYVPEGALIGAWVNHIARGVTAFYDIDTPVTLARLKAGQLDYLSANLIREYQLYLSFTGGPMLEVIERDFGSPKACPLYCSVDPALYYPEEGEQRWDLGYLGTFSSDRQPTVEQLLIEPARRWPSARMVVAGPQYPESIAWPENVERIVHLSPAEHRGFYNRQRFTLNVTRREMVLAGYSPSVRLFEAAACGTPIITDYWEGLDAFFQLGEEVLVSRSPEETLRYLRELPESDRARVAAQARERVLAAHTGTHRAAELERYVLDRLPEANLTAQA